MEHLIHLQLKCAELRSKKKQFILNKMFWGFLQNDDEYYLLNVSCYFRKV